MMNDILFLLPFVIVLLLIRATHKAENPPYKPSDTPDWRPLYTRDELLFMAGTRDYMKDAETEEEGFEMIWQAEHGSDSFATQCLDDDQYIYYKIYDDANWKELYRKYKPNAYVIRGDNPNIIFHGGCLGCKSQRLHGIDRCKGCTYFRCRGGDDLHIKGEDADTIDDWDEFIGGIKS
jgi:hypothetical protein